MQFHNIPNPFHAILFIGLTLAQLTSQSLAQDTIDLKVEFPPSQQVRITSNYEHFGDVLILKDPGQTEAIKPLKLDVEAKIAYQQRAMNSEQVIRTFDSARATIKLDEGVTKPSLSPANNLIIVRSKSNTSSQVEMASVKDTLEQSELELIQNPADPMTLPALISKTKIKQGDKWKPSQAALTKFLAVHEIQESNVELTLKKVNPRSASVYITGSIRATVDDVSTQMSISGIAVIHRKTNMLSSFKIGIHEIKKPGQIAPGFEGNTKIDLRFAKAKDSKELSNETLASHTKHGKVRQRLKWVSELGHCKMIFEPRWKMITQEEEAAVLRFIDGTRLLTQCNVVLLPNRNVSTPLTLDQYKQEISKIVEDDDTARLESSSQLRTKNGNAGLKVVVSGVEDGLPVEWLYYNVATQDGRQVAFVFTLEKSLAYRVSQIAEQLVDEFEFQELPKQIADSNSKPKTKPADTKKNR
ncbi:MAG: hypothetical protein P8J27_14220 [Mariniblastus sp.]|nr:hypothetical protein [Mariniblastus sp.]